MTAKVQVRIPRKGIASGAKAVTFDVDGVTGQSCTDLTKNLENSIGSQTAVTAKPAFYETEPTSEHLNN